ncbi:hypothetical protein BDV32DRAFT_138467 [Aspergillus pseudonomiae]|uniref:GPI anchored cell wall protein n=2 Tax=Aspergillus subgen. Circumdati TaxID=2720871 RepID=A0A0L1JFE5_ASPN3|nr:uncharacterized protein ANOM_002090 [Aspergillus nomiae NRRL 13137]XP_031945084.1 uncharacterized protein BDV37DRAFT_240059 [Aspergillus pseudonomiae]KAB8259947.1 hypothetical protein BDV32DRAFT_138467 [Aspergillus pseudonomiae]KAE8407765.1 hypothetical protein BDV37DRAFT_240059 [Aspergillus pseudonomiae]KNG90098.1 hypothetical protein ANOM_002090 [Aspergillus nomiae NRRL 13137]
MKLSSTSTLVAALVAGVNGASIPRTQGSVPITFIGAADAQFTQDFPTDGSSVAITNPLSISHIASSTDGVSCVFNGIDNSVTVVSDAETVDVGPPQTQTSGACAVGSVPPGQSEPRSSGQDVVITFVGAADAQFTQVFPTNGVATQISNRLSISHIESHAPGVSCTFNGIDHSVTTVSGVQTVDVGPPQTQISGTCHRL